MGIGERVFFTVVMGVVGPESEIFPGIREAGNEPRELAWTFCTEKCFDK